MKKSRRQERVHFKTRGAEKLSSHVGHIFGGQPSFPSPPLFLYRHCFLSPALKLFFFLNQFFIFSTFNFWVIFSVQKEIVFGAYCNKAKGNYYNMHGKDILQKMKVCLKFNPFYFSDSLMYCFRKKKDFTLLGLFPSF